MTTALITLTGKRPAGRLSRQLYQLQQEGHLCDTVIEGQDGSYLHGHSCVLASASELLNKCLLAQSSVVMPGTHQRQVFRIKTDFVSLSTWKQLVEYIYLGQATLVGEDLEELAKAADVLELSELKTLALETNEMYNQMSQKDSQDKEEVAKVSIAIQTDNDILQYTAGEKSCYPTQLTENQISAAEKKEPESYLLLHGADGTQQLVQAQPVGEGSQSYEYIIPTDQLPMLPQVDESVDVGVVIDDDGLVEHEEEKMEDDQQQIAGHLPAGLNPKSRQKGMKQDVTYRCGDCNRFYSSKQSLERHMVLHSSYAPFTCDQCGKSFKTERYLSAHVERHKDDRTHQCPICSKRFKTKRDVNWHTQTVHTDAKNFHCSMCSFKAKTAALLKQHQQSHTSAKEWICKTCGKAFLRKQHLEQHAVRHEGKRPFTCTVCQAEFYTIYACKEHHLRVHQGLKRYKCAVCSHEYNEKKSFIQHLKKHSVDILLQVEDNIIMQHDEPVTDQEIMTHSVILKDDLSTSDSMIIESVLDTSEVVL